MVTPNHRTPLAPQFPPGAISDPADGTLNKDVIAAGQGLAVLLPRWPEAAPAPGQVDTVELEWAAGTAPGEGDYVLADLQAFEGPLDDAAFPKVLTVPAAMLRPDGPYQLRYRIHGWNNTTAVSLPVLLRCDTVPPAGASPPPQPGIPAEFISDDYLASNPEGVACGIPVYEGAQPGDRVRYWWLTDASQDPGTITPVGDVQINVVPATVHVPPEVVQAAGDGGCYLRYQVYDKATNASHVSTPLRVAVALGPLPTHLLPPQVPLADDGLLTLQDALTGIEVTVPAFDNGKPTDRFTLTWGGAVLLDQTLAEAGTFPLTLRVPDQVLRDVYGAATGPVLTTVAYRVQRGDVPFTSPAATVAVDLFAPGPELPDWPDPINPQLPPARVFGAVSNQENVLTRDDGEQAAAVRLILYEPLRTGDLIEFFWSGTPVPEATYTVTAGDQPGAEISVSIPWTYIEAAGNQPELPVYYRLRAPGSPNEQIAPTTLVNADAFTLRPPAPKFLKTVQAGPGEALVCASLDGPDNAVLVEVPDLSAWLSVGDFVTLTWIPVARPEGEEIVTRSIKEEPILLGEPGYPVTGFVWRVRPYLRHVYPMHAIVPDGQIKQGRARAHYSFMYEGERVRSHQTECITGMYTAEGTCNLNAFDH